MIDVHIFHDQSAILYLNHITPLFTLTSKILTLALNLRKLNQTFISPKIPSHFLLKIEDLIFRLFDLVARPPLHHQDIVLNSKKWCHIPSFSTFLAYIAHHPNPNPHNISSQSHTWLSLFGHFQNRLHTHPLLIYSLSNSITIKYIQPHPL